MNKFLSHIKPFADYGIYIAFTLALMSLVGSLYFSDVMHLAPCLLCWWGRIMMYPLVVIFGVGILRRDKAVVYYSAPLVAIGTVIGAYHSLLQWKIIPEGIVPCVAGVSCADATWQLFGFVTIPFLEFITFIAIAICLLAYHLTRPKATA